MARPRPRQVALVFPLGLPHMERVTRGILEFARAERNWHFVFNPEATYVSLDSLETWRGDGIIGSFDTAAEAHFVASLKIPAVNISSAVSTPLLPTVTIDNWAVGRLAAEHLLARGFRQFGYYGLSDLLYGCLRGAGFAEAIESAGFRCAQCLTKSSFKRAQPWRWDRAQLQSWLRRLHPPVGILAAHDPRARLLLFACATVGLRVPEDVAVIGVDDDVVSCELANPPLSSVAWPGVSVGRKAAELLARLMKNGGPSTRPILIAPSGVVARRSSETFAFENEATRSFVELVKKRIEHPVNIAQLIDELGIPRRRLELQIRESLGCTPHDYLRRTRVERARTLLSSAESFTLDEVARQCGFTGRRHLNAALRQEAGVATARPESAAARGGARRALPRRPGRGGRLDRGAR